MAKLSKKHILILFIVVCVAAAVGGILWQVSHTSRKDSSSQSRLSTFSGRLSCLPHKDTSDPTTEECAYGLLADDGKYYSLSEADPREELIINAPFNTPVTVKGAVKPDGETKYRTSGHIVVEEIIKK